MIRPFDLPLDWLERAPASRDQIRSVRRRQSQHDLVLVQRRVALTLEDVDRAAEEDTALRSLHRDERVEALNGVE